MVGVFAFILKVKGSNLTNGVLVVSSTMLIEYLKCKMSKFTQNLMKPRVTKLHFSVVITKMGRCKLKWLMFCVLMDFLQNVFYSNATITL
jgi:hypothetical protein